MIKISAHAWCAINSIKWPEILSPIKQITLQITRFCCYYKEKENIGFLQAVDYKFLSVLSVIYFWTGKN